MKMIAVLRLGHRISRDKRVTTHVALVSRVLGVDKMFVDKKDGKLEETIHAVCERFGGDFSIETGVNWRHVIRDWRGVKVHLTMYGEPFEDAVEEIRKKDGDLLVIVGAEKVPPEVYQLSDYNVAVGNQPHSEIAALALFLDRYTMGKWQRKMFKGKIEVIPSKRGKKVVTRE
ncbi:MAG: tRNA (cytidine(56)-2'-O)-methyltransferase [Thermoplasmata archaeon]|nr:MAG: tRNA (cytidine(56)-2'-O)-methyltransferase [Thermoplasmata archaeon]